MSKLSLSQLLCSARRWGVVLQFTPSPTNRCPPDVTEDTLGIKWGTPQWGPQVKLLFYLCVYSTFFLNLKDYHTLILGSTQWNHYSPSLCWWKQCLNNWMLDHICYRSSEVEHFYKPLTVKNSCFLLQIIQLDIFSPKYFIDLEHFQTFKQPVHGGTVMPLSHLCSV